MLSDRLEMLAHLQHWDPRWLLLCLLFDHIYGMVACPTRADETFNQNCACLCVHSIIDNKHSDICILDVWMNHHPPPPPHLLVRLDTEVSLVWKILPVQWHCLWTLFYDQVCVFVWCHTGWPAKKHHFLWDCTSSTSCMTSFTTGE